MTRTTFLLLLLAPFAAAQDQPKPEGENFYRECKLGDWVSAKSPNGVVMKHSVVAKSDDSLTIRIEQTVDGKAGEPIEYQVDLRIAYPPPMKKEETPNFKYTSTQEKVDSGKETLTIGDKQYECTWEKTKHTTVTEFDGNVTKTVMVVKNWRCKDVPLGWPVRTETDLENGTKMTTELTGFGRGQ